MGCQVQSSLPATAARLTSCRFITPGDIELPPAPSNQVNGHIYPFNPTNIITMRLSTPAFIGINGLLSLTSELAFTSPLAH